MILYLGDFPVGTTVPFPFPAYDSSGASVTITGLATTDIEVYKGTSITQRASDNGFALIDTDGIDLDGRTGIHGFSIDLSDNSDSGFYAAGSIYWVVVDAITVDSQTVRFIFYFTIGLRLYPTTIGRTLDVSSGGEAGVDWANIGSPTTTVNLSGTTVKDATDVNTDTDTLLSRLGTPSNLGGGATVAANLADIESQTDDIGAAGAGLTALATAAELAKVPKSDSNVTWNATAAAQIQSEANDALVAYDPPTRTEATSDKDEILTRLGTPAGASVSADIADVEGKVDDLESRLGTPSDLGSGATVAANLVDIESQTDDIGTAGAGLTALATAAELAKVPKSDGTATWNATAAAQIQQEVQDAIEANHLDHLLAADYNPASKPGVSTALLNELVESDGGVSRFTANALEQAPSGGGGGGGGEVTGFSDAALAELAGITIRVTNPFRGVREPLEIVQGDDYSDDDGNGITFTIAGYADADVSGAEATLTLKKGSTSVTFTATSVTRPDDDIVILFEPTSDETAELEPSSGARHGWQYDVQIELASGHKLTPIAEAPATVLASFSD